MSQFVTSGIPLLQVLPLALAFVLLSLALGRRLLVVLGATGESVPERGLIALGLGAGSLQFIPFALGTIGLLRPLYVSVALLIAAALLARDLKAVLFGAHPLLTWFQAQPRWIKLWGLALLPTLLCAALMAVTPTTDPDGLSYHLTAPKRWLQAGSLVYLPTYPYTNAPMGVEMLFALGLATAGDIAAKVVHLVLGSAALVGSFLAGARYKGPTAGILVATLYLVAPRSVAPILGAAYVEGAAALAMVASLLAWLIWYQTRVQGWLRAGALLAGIAVTFKMTAVVFPLALGAATIASLWLGDTSGTLKASLIKVGRLLPLLSLPVLPWLTRAAIFTGNPLFPVLAKYIPSRDYTAEQASRFEEYNRYVVWAGDRGTGWSLDQRKMIFAAFALCLLAVGAVFFVRAHTKQQRSIVTIVLLGTMLQLYAAGLYIRYWMPILAVLTVPLVAWLGPLLVKKWQQTTLIVITGALSLYQARQILLALNNDVSGAVLTTLGIEDEHDYRMEHLPLTPLYDYVNTKLPPDSKVLLAYYCAGFHIDRTTFCGEFVQSSLRYDSWESFISDARRLGVSHVIAPRMLAAGKAPPIGSGNSAVLVRESESVVLKRLLMNHASLLDQALDMGLYEVHWPSVPSALGSSKPRGL